jgi:hypothetical protein
MPFIRTTPEPDAGRRIVRLAIAFLIAPLATGGVIWLTLFVPWLLDWHFFVFPYEPYQRVVQVATIVAGLAIEIAGVVTLVGGVPAYLLFRRMRWLRLEHFALLGVVLGWVPFRLLALVRPLARDWFPMSLLGIICGLASSIVFWLIGVAPRHREPEASERSHRGAA